MICVCVLSLASLVELLFLERPAGSIASDMPHRNLVLSNMAFRTRRQTCISFLLSISDLLMP
jgi:hypothetical protein